MFVLMILPLLAIVYVSWHVWVMLPVPALWKWLAIAVIVLSVVMLFLNFSRKFDGLPLPVAKVAYEIGTSSIIILMYIVMVFLVLDLGRLSISCPSLSFIIMVLRPAPSSCFFSVCSAMATSTISPRCVCHLN